MCCCCMFRGDAGESGGVEPHSTGPPAGESEEDQPQE